MERTKAKMENAAKQQGTGMNSEGLNRSLLDPMKRDEMANDAMSQIDRLYKQATAQVQ